MTDIMTSMEFVRQWVCDGTAEEMAPHIAAIEARDAAIRADQARRDVEIARTRCASPQYHCAAINAGLCIAAEIERRHREGEGR